MNIIEKAVAVLPPLAHKAAAVLANSYGHLWGGVWPATGLLYGFPDQTEVAEILNLIQEKAAEANSGNGIRGLELLDALGENQAGSPQYTHRTGSGRLSWKIYPSENVAGFSLELTVARPSGVAIALTWADEWALSNAHGTIFYERHVDALREAVDCVKGFLGSVPQDLWDNLARKASSNLEKAAAAAAKELAAKYGLEMAADLAATLNEMGGGGLTLAYYLER